MSTEDDQVFVMTSLAFIQLERKFLRLPEVPNPPGATSNEHQMLSILNWIASYFVRNARGNCVASALSVQDHKITLYLAANRGKPEEVDIQNGEKMISTLRQAFYDPQPKSATRLLFDSAISITYNRFYHELDMIKDMQFPLLKTASSVNVPPIEMFEKLVTKMGDLELDTGLINVAQRMAKEDLVSHGSGGEGSNALKAVFKAFVGMIDSEKGSNPQFLNVAWSGFCYLAMLLVRSDFFSRVVSNDISVATFFNAEELNWLRKLRRRLWRIARYRTDAKLVATTGIEWIRRILGDNGFTDSRLFGLVLTLTHFPRTTVKEYEIKERPGDRFDALLKDFGYNSTQKDSDFMASLESLWPNDPFPSFFVPFLHCELQLISYLDRHNIEVHMNLIGVSKLMCWACNVYVREINKRREDDGKEPYVLSGTSGKAHDRWLIPPGELGDVVVKIVRCVLKDAIERLADELGIWHSGGSDSSMGLISGSDSNSAGDEMDQLMKARMF